MEEKDQPIPGKLYSVYYQYPYYPHPDAAYFRNYGQSSRWEKGLLYEVVMYVKHDELMAEHSVIRSNGKIYKVENNTVFIPVKSRG